jgi:hypothetical protein
LAQSGGGMFNVTMESGTNQFHGSAYEYFVNEFLNAGQPLPTLRPARAIRARSTAATTTE